MIKVSFEKAKENIGKVIFSLAGIAGGIVSLSLASFSYATLHDKMQTYGGDAYTGIQNAAARTVNNVGILINVLEEIGEALLLVFGISLICYFGLKLAECFEIRLVKEKNTETPVEEVIDIEGEENSVEE